MAKQLVARFKCDSCDFIAELEVPSGATDIASIPGWSTVEVAKYANSDGLATVHSANICFCCTKDIIKNYKLKTKNERIRDAE